MSHGSTWAIVPVKALGQAKRRLSGVLPDAARERLVLAMLEDVLAAVAGVAAIDGVVVVTPDPRVAELARSRGAAILPEPPAAELNAAIESGLAYARSRGAAEALILPADIPLATPGELEGLLASRDEQPGVTLAPSHDGNGTNALLLAPPDAISPCYGPGSYLEHLSQAMARRIDVNVLHLAGIARDIDEAADLRVLAAAAPERYGFLDPHLAAGSHRPAAAEEQ
jgi:2-phospho-L-lactate guanylyltransferase